MKAIWKDAVIAESADTVVVENYYDVVVGRVAFWQGVRVEP